MILDSDRNDMAKTSLSPAENPPAYSSSNIDPLVDPQTPIPSQERQYIGPNTWIVKRSEVVPSVPQMPSTTVYHYVDPVTQDHLASFLPPNHPEMICLQEGGHVVQTKFGLLGILAAVFWFPLGIGLCLLDRRVKCKRCGLTIDDGVCA